MTSPKPSGPHASASDRLTELLHSPLGLLALLRLPRVGPIKALRTALLTAGQEAFLEDHAERWSQALDEAGAELEDCRQADVTALAIFDERYPPRLRTLHDPPPVLFVRGRIEALHQPRSVAVVGTREPTSFGVSAAEKITATLADADWSIVSGLAKGIDTVAHATALRHRAATVAVMAGGLDRIYPAENQGLAGAIVESGGALISEQRWGSPVHRSNFVQRNRLQTGLVTAVVVAQTDLAGGTMSTVRYAASQGRPVFCPIPNTSHDKNRGLRVLLDTPALNLCELIPAWKDSRALCARLGNRALALPIHNNRLHELIDTLEMALDCDTQLNPEPRWWPAYEPLTRLPTHIVEGDEQELLFA